jgi:hypothetical protein
MSMYNDYEFDVLEVHPSGLLSYQSGKVTTSRKFKMSCEHAEEFALRQFGKFWSAGTPLPVLPIPFPFDWTDGQVRKHGRMNLVASSFSIEPLSAACFGNNLPDERTPIGDPANIDQMALYFKVTPANPEEVQPNNSCCECIVTISYEENPCDCCGYDPDAHEWVVDDYILPGTCLSVERNPAYEMVTLPSANLVWRDMPRDTPEQQRARQLRADSYAYKIIPKADLIVSWHNVPVNAICAIESHLREFRGKVNETAWGSVMSCDAYTELESGFGGVVCEQYDPETIMFVDYQEDRSRRTDAFGGNYLIASDTANNMNTTTLKLIFKQKRVERTTAPTVDDPYLSYGWNHLFFDRNTEDESPGEWMRVGVDNETQDAIFPPMDFSDIFYPPL